MTVLGVGNINNRWCTVKRGEEEPRFFEVWQNRFL